MNLNLGERWLVENISTGAISEMVVEELPNGAASIYARTTVGWLPVADAPVGVHGAFSLLEQLPPRPPQGLVKFEWTEFNSGTDGRGDFLTVKVHAEVDGRQHALWLRHGEPGVLSDENVIG